ncbi:type II toxin-antitoxin system PemK/MazF family toxin [Agromyces sp. MMS24-JH15]|uniref:type II toxin-antitoxin system PemK/MazF family toxin n=1 Tax=Agromyces sp. MMS24-JH15 TaxID=3243765 RepID=UPI003748EC41
MPDTSRFLTALRRVLKAFGRDASSKVAKVEPMPGQHGADATVQLEPGLVRRVRLDYAPRRDGDPDPGEVVWTWVPFEERDGRGKDRPVAIVATDGRGGFLAVELTSRPHPDHVDYLAIGTGEWDASGRASWARLDRLYRVRAGGMRREAAALDADRYAVLADALRSRYGWK